MKKIFKFFLFSAMVLTGLGVSIKFVNANTGAASNDFSDFWTIKGIGSLANTAIAYIGTNRNFHLYDGDVILGSKGNQPSTTTGEYPGFKVQIKNCGATAWVQGTLVVADPNAVGCGAKGGATTDLTSWIGVSEGAVAVGAIGNISVGGYALALTTGTVSRGDTLVSTTSAAGYLTGDSTPTSGADVAVALSSGTAAGGLTIVRLR